MASKSVVDAIKAYLTASSWNGPPIVHPNEIEEAPADASEYIRIDYPVARASQVSVGVPGANVWREEGAFRFVIYARRGVDLDQALGWADQLAALFRGKSFGGVLTFAPSPPATDDESDNGNYYILAVAVPYKFDYLG